jgi:hypothetical protein
MERVLKDKAKSLSKKINYKAIGSLFDDPKPDEKKLGVPDIINTPGVGADDYDVTSISGARRRKRSDSNSSVVSRVSASSVVSRLSQGYRPATPQSQNRVSISSLRVDKKQRLDLMFSDTHASFLDKRNNKNASDPLTEVQRRIQDDFLTPDTTPPNRTPKDPDDEEVVAMVGDDDTIITFENDNDNEEDYEEDEEEDGYADDSCLDAKHMLGYGDVEDDDGYDEV